MNRFIVVVERIAGAFLGVVAVITFGEAILRYVFNSHLPDGFVLGQVLQGIAICWGIGTATYADRHFTVDLLYSMVGARVQRTFDVMAFTIMFGFMVAFGAMISVKVHDIYLAGEISTELNVPIWIGYTVASLGILAAVVLAALRWWQVVFLRR